MSSLSNLKVRNGTYYALLNVPRPHRAAVGRNELLMTLKTRDLGVANKLKFEALSRLQELLAAKVANDPERIAMAEAFTWKETLHAERGIVMDAPRNVPESTEERAADALRTRAEELRDNVGPTVARRFYMAATGRAVFLRDLLPRYIADLDHVIEKTKHHYAAAVNEFLAWNGKNTTTREVTRTLAADYVAHIKPKCSPKTAQTKVSALMCFWTWMMAKGHIENNPLLNPWSRQGVGKKSKRAEKKKRRAWEDSELLVILSSALVDADGVPKGRGNSSPFRRSLAPHYRNALPVAVRLALFTGARMDEICEWKAGVVRKDEAGMWIMNEEGKSEAARRRIPVHPAIRKLVERLAAQPDKEGYLLHDLPRGGPDKIRSHHLSKVFGDRKRALGLTDTTIVFHSLRNTFAEVMEAEGVPVMTVKKIIGHERGDLTFGGYSKGERLDLQGAIKKLRYSAAVMKAL